MAVDWMGVGIALLIIFTIILIVIAKIQGDRVVDVLAQIVEVFKK